jgi:NAD(P)-dependent dehydrogenase (short-subunit alcohol dehydrogenase family)
MKIIVIGATGTIGRAVAEALATEHEVVRASRRGDVKVDIEDPRSIEALFQRVRDVDAVVSCAGDGRFVPLAQLTDDDIAYSLRNKLMGQVNVIRQALRSVRQAGSVTVTSGVLAQRPMPGGAAISMVNAGLEGFVRGAAAEAPRGVRVNAVSPPWIRETLIALRMDPSQGLPAVAVARAYVAAVTGTSNGATLDPAAFA